MSITAKNLVALVTLGVLWDSTVPAAPTITVVDDGTGTSFTATIAGASGTVQLYYRKASESSWTTGSTRSGNGDIQETGLTQRTLYYIYATDTVNSITSAPSAMATVYLNPATDDTIETAIRDILLNDGDVLALTSTRIYPNVVPQGISGDVVTYQQVSGDRGHSYDGADGLASPRFQVNGWSSAYSGSRELSEAIRRCLDGYSGTVNGVVIQVIKLADESDMPQMKAGTDQLMRYGKRLDFDIWYEEPTT